MSRIAEPFRSKDENGQVGLVPLREQDRGRWDRHLIAEGVQVLQRALAQDRLGEYQPQAAIAALHADAPSVDETDWVQIVEWYDELVRLTVPERDHLTRQAARLNARLRG